MRFDAQEIAQAQAIYAQLEGQPRELIARRFGFDGFQPSSYRELAEVFGKTHTWANEHVKRLLAEIAPDLRQGASFDPEELLQAQAMHPNLEGQDQDLVARRFGLTGYQPHTYKELGEVFDKSAHWAEYNVRRFIPSHRPSPSQRAQIDAQEIAQAQAIYAQLEGQPRELIARRFGFDGYQPHTYKEIGAVFGGNPHWAEHIHRLLINEPQDRRRAPRINNQEITQAQAIYDQLEGPDRELIARRFGFDGFQPHTCRELEEVCERSRKWVATRIQQLIPREILDTQLDQRTLTTSLNANRGARFKPSELILAQAIYDRLDEPDRELIARRFGFDGYQSHTYEEIGTVFGQSYDRMQTRIKKLITNEPADRSRGAQLETQEVVQALAIYDRLDEPDRELIARRFGFDGHQPHTLKQLGPIFGKKSGADVGYDAYSQANYNREPGLGPTRSP